MWLTRFDLSGKIALVTGASRGIGEAIAKLLAAHGAHVVVSSRKADACAKVVGDIEKEGGRAEAIACHIGEPAQIEDAMRRIEASHGRLDILVNNAATNPYFGPVVDADLGAFQKTVDVNIRGFFVASCAAAKLMQKNGGGAIVNIASISGVVPGPNQGVYSITKAAVIGMTKVFAAECASMGVRVNAVLPASPRPSSPRRWSRTRRCSAITSSTCRSSASRSRPRSRVPCCISSRRRRATRRACACPSTAGISSSDAERSGAGRVPARARAARSAGRSRSSRLSGGQSNPTFRLRADGRSYVLRKQPEGELLPSAHAVDREYRVITALGRTDVPVPRTYCYCDDRSVIGTPFYVMEFSDGRHFWDPALPELDRRTAPRCGTTSTR